MAKINMDEEFTTFASPLGQRIINACRERGEEATNYAKKCVENWDNKPVDVIITNKYAWKLLCKIEKSFPKKKKSSDVANMGVGEDVSLFSFDQ